MQNLLNNTILTNKQENNKTFEELLNYKDDDGVYNILRGIDSYGYVSPSEVQLNGITIMLKYQYPNDIVIQSQSGTGKTATFIISLLGRIIEYLGNDFDNYTYGPLAFILAPTHELATQIYNVTNELKKFTRIKTSLCIGGFEISNDIMKTHILIGTPGKIYSLYYYNTCIYSSVRMIVLDECDQLLQNRFIDQTNFILNKLPKDTQRCLFSATFTNELLNFIEHEHIISNGIKLLMRPEELTLHGIMQFKIDCAQDYIKNEILSDLYNKINIGQCIIYVNTLNRQRKLKIWMENNGHAISIINGKQDKIERSETMKKFRSGETRVLISTDLLSRGIDIQNISIVINFDFPFKKEEYLHRIGRSGRYGRKGLAISFVTQRDIYLLNDIQDYYKIEINDLPSQALESLSNIYKNN